MWHRMARCLQSKTLTAANKRKRVRIQCFGHVESILVEDSCSYTMLLCPRINVLCFPLRLILTLTWNPIAFSSSSTIFQVSSRASGVVSVAEVFLSPRDFFRLTFFLYRDIRARHSLLKQYFTTKVFFVLQLLIFRCLDLKNIDFFLTSIIPL